MAPEVQNAHNSNFISDEVRKIVGDIARDADFEDFEIIVKDQAFSGDNYIGDISRVKISSSNNGQKSIDLILKKAPLLASSRETIPLAKFFEREIFVYTDILPALDSLQESNGLPAEERFSYAKFFKGTTEEFKEMIIMKDLSSDGYVMRDKMAPFDLEDAEIVIKKIASLHANSFVLKEKNRELFIKLSNNVAHSMNYGDRMMEVVHLTIDKVLLGIDNLSHKAKVEEFSKNIQKDIYPLLDAKLSEPYSVICHGDCWNNNMLFKYKDGKVDDVILIDWQIVRLASPATDLTYMICMSMDQALMETHLQHLKELYYETLSLAITKMDCDPEKCYPKEIFNEQFNRQMSFGFFMGLCAIPTILSEPKDAKPMEEAIKDLDNGVCGVVINDRTSGRLKGLIDYFVRHDLI